MKRLLNNPYFYLGIAFLLIVGMLFLHKATDDAYIKREEKRLGSLLQNHLNEKRNQAVKLLNNTRLLTAIEKRNLDDPSILAISKQYFYLVCTKNDSLFFWNSNQAMIDSSIIHRSDSLGLASVGQRSFLVVKRKLGKFQCFLLYNAGDFSDNSVLPDDHPFNEGGGYVYKIGKTTTGFPMKWKNSDPIANFNLIDIEGIGRGLVLFSILFVVLLVFFIFKFIELSNEKGISVVTFLNITAVCLLIRLLLYRRLILQAIQNTELFNPEIYASSFLLPSLGDLILHIICFLVVFYAFTRIKNRQFLYIPETKYILLKTTVLCIIFLFSTDLVFSIIKSLVVDSNISFHFADLPKINIYSFLGLTVIGVIMGSLFYLSSFLFRSSGFRLLPKRKF